MISEQKYCTEFINKKCDKCRTEKKENRKCIRNMHEIDGWW